MNYAQNNLQYNEELLSQSKINSIITASNWFSIVITLIIMIILFCVEDTHVVAFFALFILLLELILLVRKIIIIYTNELTLTNKRVIIKSGIIARHICEAPLEKIDNIAVSQRTLSSRIFGYGTIKIETTSEPMFLNYVSDVNQFKNGIVKIIDKKKTDAANAIAMQQAKELARAIIAAKQIKQDEE